MEPFKVNGNTAEFDGDSATPLLWVIRDHLDLKGTKFGCGIGQCGACTVHIDGQARRSCITPVSSVAGQDITTIEGVTGDVTRAVQDAWVAIDVPQCGYCQSGQVMSAIALLTENPAPGDEDIDNAMSGNICRCATYVRIRRAIHDAVAALEG